MTTLRRILTLTAAALASLAACSRAYADEPDNPFSSWHGPYLYCPPADSFMIEVRTLPDSAGPSELSMTEAGASRKHEWLDCCEIMMMDELRRVYGDDQSSVEEHLDGFGTVCGTMCWIFDSRELQPVRRRFWVDMSNGCCLRMERLDNGEGFEVTRYVIGSQERDASDDGSL